MILGLAKDTVFGLAHFAVESIKWFSRHDFREWQLNGPSRSEGNSHLRVTFFGRQDVCNDLAQSLFQSEPVITSSAPIRRRDADRLPAPPDADLVVREAPPYRGHPFHGGMLHQTLLDSRLPLLPSFDSYVASSVSKTIRRTIRSSNEMPWTIEWSESPADVEEFYESLLRPSAVGRHGSRTHLPPMRYFQRQWKPRSLVFIKNDTGRRVGGLITQHGRWTPWRLLRIGLDTTLAADPKTRHLLNTRLVAETLREACSTGQREVSLGLSPAFATNGIWQHKQYWGTEPGRVLTRYPICEILPTNENGQQVLQAINPFIIDSHAPRPMVTNKREQTAPAGVNLTEEHRSTARTMKHLGKATAISMALGLLLRFALPRALGPERLGMLYFCESLGAIFFTFLPLGLATYITREIPSNHARAKEIMPTMTPALFLWGATLWAAMMFSTLGTDPITVACAAFMGVYSFCMVFQRSILRRVYLAMGRSSLTASIEVWVRVLLVALVASAIALKAGVITLAFCYALSEVAGVGFLLRRAGKEGMFDSGFNPRQLHDMVSSSLPFFAVGALIEIYGNVDTTMLRYYEGNHEVAFYGCAVRLKGIALMLVPIMQAAVHPTLSRLWHSDRDAFRAMVSHWMRVLVVISLPMTLGLMAVPDLLSDILFGHEFRPAWRTISYLAPVLALTYMNVLMGASLSICSDGKGFLKITALSVLINILLNFIMIPWADDLWGDGGGAAGSSLATVISEVFVLLAVRRIFREGLDSHTLRRLLVLMTIPCAALGIAYPWLLEINAWLRLSLMLTLTPLYMFITQIAHPRDLSQAWTLMRQRH